MNNQKLKYTNYDIVFQEVPDEISLAINISGCPHKCEGCHSAYLWNYEGNYISEDIDKILKEYKSLITCVCMLGGDQNVEELNQILSDIKNKYFLRTCLYSGLDSIDTLKETIPYLDYLKLGSYQHKLGGLQSKNTNQIFYKIINKELIDITNKFKLK
jgi:anaerobic ribonucleoside-triphosphate reductase activating protein